MGKREVYAADAERAHAAERLAERAALHMEFQIDRVEPERVDGGVPHQRRARMRDRISKYSKDGLHLAALIFALLCAVGLLGLLGFLGLLGLLLGAGALLRALLFARVFRIFALLGARANAPLAEAHFEDRARRQLIGPTHSRALMKRD